ncbi:ABC transporter permease [Ureaplasma parvum]|uniref:Spermidine/putrescine transport system permease n=2 Tax=Ureaplasma parvum serovar 3 TaxID=38504 RepID=Q9PR36_UREPA|nr:ABC transporter permease [Ureaplasma parvum]pir/F82932/ spermidine/putrescine transport system permease UU108 [imported] - Ureaplasma urealyticum [Ureaplasma urealyticum]AAF30514.1 spermidine/putrescine transport system permease [Ureaplasma parvum serovar 3 str. ATCC 700970]ACA32716.1 spermidine/putrescine transport system permease [Ureaplasma parvum serovar 3 str. ATCC 27815]EDT87726.1 ABC transporter, permease protein [Ureaplasma parvum serovar 14 str. ATCC 33697]EDU19089.1 spermidine/put
MNKQFNFNFAPSKLSDINKKNETVFFLKEVKVIKKNNRKHYKQTLFDKLKMNKALILTIPYFLVTIFLLIIPLVSIIVKTFINNTDSTGVTTNIIDNWSVITPTIGMKIFNSLWIAAVATIFCLIIGYPFAYFLSIGKSKFLKAIAIALITSPIWMSMLVKLIGIKTFFDVVNGEINSTHGHIFTILGLVYINLPLMILPIYTSLSTMPKNLVNASYDLGRGFFYTFFHIVIPYTKNALISGVWIVYLAAFTSVVVSGFLNNDNAGGLIGGEIFAQGQDGISSGVQLSRSSTITLVISLILLGIYLIIVIIPKIVQLIYYKRKNLKKGVKNNEAD